MTNEIQHPVDLGTDRDHPGTGAVNGVLRVSEGIEFLHMAKADNLGSFETLVLLAVMRLQQNDNAYGATIARELEERTSRWILIPAVYESLESMRKKGYLTCWQEEEPTHQRGGKRKRFYKLTTEGEEAINLAIRDVYSMAYGLTLWGMRDSCSAE